MVGRTTDAQTRDAAFALHVCDEDHSCVNHKDFYGALEHEEKLDGALPVIFGRNWSVFRR